jgi:glycosyltransferase involved in cell wall biosynthesis
VKLLIVSHACATPINQSLYAEVAKQTQWDVDLVIPSNWMDEYGRICSAERWCTFNGRLIRIPVCFPGNIIGHAYRARFSTIIRESKPDAIYVAHEPYAVATAQVYHSHSLSRRKCRIGFYSAQNIQKTYPPPFRWTEAAVHRLSHFAFPVSASVAHVLARKEYRGISRILPLAIDTDVYYPRPDVASIRERLTDGSDILLGYVGRLVPEKGLRTLVKALGLLPRHGWKMALIGSGPLEAELRTAIAAHQLQDKVIFCGFVPHTETPRFLSALDVLVVPSESQPNWREQFGRVVLEALACGTPVVGSDSGEIPVLLTATGGGVTFTERDPDGLAAALIKMIRCKRTRDRHANAGAAAVTSRFTLQAIAKDFADTITESMG